jgi:hypothetical protein
MLGNLASGGFGSDVLPGLKNEAKLQKLIRFVRVKGYTNFLNQFITLRDALKGFDLDSYNRCYQDLFDQVEKSPVEATEIYNYVNSFR